MTDRELLELAERELSEWCKYANRETYALAKLRQRLSKDDYIKCDGQHDGRPCWDPKCHVYEGIEE